MLDDKHLQLIREMAGVIAIQGVLINMLTDLVGKRLPEHSAAKLKEFEEKSLILMKEVNLYLKERGIIERTADVDNTQVH